MIALFARSNHPHGYGFSCNKEGVGSAHGYVVIGVRCRTAKERDRVVQLITSEGCDLPDSGRIIYPNGKPDEPYNRTVRMHQLDPDSPVIRWYSGGPFDWDYLFTFKGNDVTWPSNWTTYGSRGDNRFCMIYDAKDILDA
jgi:hypothetical protein